MMKIAFVGGGSTYSPAIIQGFLQSSWGAVVDEISLIDSDPMRLRAMTFLSKMVVDSMGKGCIVTANERIREGLEGADFVILQIRTGGLAGRHRDETLPLSCGCVGNESVGAGGFFHAMRVIPEVMKIAQEVAEVCPGAWVLVLSNPTGIIVRALLERYTFHVIGVCDVPFDVTERIASLMEVTPGSLKVTTAGLNHGSYVISIKQEEKEILPSFLAGWTEKHEEMLGFSRELVQTLQAIPCVPYMRYFYNPEEVFKEQSEKTCSRAQEVEKWQRDIFGRYEQQPMEMLDQLMKERRAPLYAKMITSVCGALSGEGDNMFACLTTRNDGVVSEMSKDSVVEVPCLLSENRCEPEGSVSLPIPALAIVQRRAIYEKLAVQAAFNPCKESILKALLVNQLVGTWDKAVELAKMVEPTFY